MKNKLRNLRLQKGLSQENIAFALGISQKAYSKIENGQTCLSKDKVLKLCNLFEVSPDYFCDISCECKAKSNEKIARIKEFLKQKGIDFPDFLS